MTKEQWIKRSRLRQAQGLCSYCYNKIYKGGIRCKKHFLINREKCLNWSREHYKEQRAKEIVSFAEFVKKGLCPICKPHNKLEGKFKRCKPCRDKHRLKYPWHKYQKSNL